MKPVQNICNFTRMKTDFIEELRWRGLLQDMMPGTEELLKKDAVKGYIGFDPTADSLHIGNLVQIITLMRFGQAGHQPVVLIGGATGMVGDPSGKSAERNLLDEATLERNVSAITGQLKKFLANAEGSAPAVFVNNYDWMKTITFLDFIRDAGKHLTVSYMMAKDSVKNRLEGGMSFTEFSYQLIQAYDFLKLYNDMDCRLQMGGSDQWGNITSGSELIRRKANGEAYALTTQLVKKADGSKFGKSESGNVWLDREKTSPYRFYQFWINTSDEDARNWIRIFTFLSQNEIEVLVSEHDRDPGKRVLQKALARELTVMVHSQEDYDAAVVVSQVLFQGGIDDLAALDDKTFEDVFEGVPQFTVSSGIIEGGVGLLDFLVTHTSIFPSKGEARKLIQAGGLSINKQKAESAEIQLGTEHLVRERYILIQKGKRNYYLCSLI
jgi:tyrosyl-tRNA synthetase